MNCAWPSKCQQQVMDPGAAYCRYHEKVAAGWTYWTCGVEGCAVRVRPDRSCPVHHPRPVADPTSPPRRRRNVDITRQRMASLPSIEAVE